VLEVDVEEKHLQPFGYFYRGAIASVMDATAFWVVFLQVKDGMGLTTVEIKVNYLAPVQKGKLVAKGRCIKIGKTLVLGNVFINSAEGNLLAHGTATMMVVPDLKVEGQENLPPKLIKFCKWILAAFITIIFWQELCRSLPDIRLFGSVQLHLQMLAPT